MSRLSILRRETSLQQSSGQLSLVTICYKQTNKQVTESTDRTNRRSLRWWFDYLLDNKRLWKLAERLCCFLHIFNFCRLSYTYAIHLLVAVVSIRCNGFYHKIVISWICSTSIFMKIFEYCPPTPGDFGRIISPLNKMIVAEILNTVSQRVEGS